MQLKDTIESWFAPLERKLNFRFYFLRFNSCYWAIPDRQDLDDALWKRRSAMVGIDLREREQLRMLEEFRQRYADEYNQLELRFGPVDAQILHCMTREHKPKRVIEIGCGNSTHLIAQALLKNAKETGRRAEFMTVDPQPPAYVSAGVEGLDQLITGKVQDVPLEAFEQLEANDILFIDSSHVLSIGSDVQYEVLEILPRLAKGVLIHFHDILLPAEYHRTWVMEGRFWGEQYVLQAFLSFNIAFEVLWAGHYMHLNQRETLKRAFANYEPTSCAPSSFWIRRVG